MKKEKIKERIEKIKKIKKIKIEKVFGKQEDKSYFFKRNLFFIVLLIIFLVFFFFKRYFNFLILLDIINIKYFKLVNFVSLLGLLIVVFCFHLADRAFKINFKKKHYFFVYFMSITGITLSFLYFKYTNYDKIEHFFFPMMFASMVYYIISKQKISLSWKLFFTFFIVIGSLSIYELLEYFLDFLFDWKLQGVFLENPVSDSGYEIILDKIDDTMIDIFLGIVGTLIYIVSVAFIEKRKEII